MKKIKQLRSYAAGARGGNAVTSPAGTSDKTKTQRLKRKFMSTFYAKWGAEKKRYLTSGNQCFYSNITPASLILGKVRKIPRQLGNHKLMSPWCRCHASKSTHLNTSRHTRDEGRKIDMHVHLLKDFKCCFRTFADSMNSNTEPNTGGGPKYLWHLKAIKVQKNIWFKVLEWFVFLWRGAKWVISACSVRCVFSLQRGNAHLSDTKVSNIWGN